MTLSFETDLVDDKNENSCSLVMYQGETIDSVDSTK
jgi:hypothetical protein